MNRFSRQIASYWRQTGAVIRNEMHTVFTDKGVMLVLIFALLIYATAYSLAYGSQVLHNVPLGVVDESRTPASRALIDAFNSGPNVYTAYTPTSMEEAKELFHAFGRLSVFFCQQGFQAVVISFQRSPAIPFREQDDDLIDNIQGLNGGHAYQTSLESGKIPLQDCRAVLLRPYIFKSGILHPGHVLL